MGQEEHVTHTVLSVDPGRSKCGVAVVRGMPVVTLLAKVVPTESLVVEIGAAIREFPKIESIVMGNGTRCHVLKRAIIETFHNLPILLVDERNSTQRARVAYVTSLQNQGWNRLLPVGLRVPDRPIDDVVAELLAKDFLEALAK